MRKSGFAQLMPKEAVPSAKENPEIELLEVSQQGLTRFQNNFF